MSEGGRLDSKLLHDGSRLAKDHRLGMPIARIGRGARSSGGSSLNRAVDRVHDRRVYGPEGSAANQWQ